MAQSIGLQLLCISLAHSENPLPDMLVTQLRRIIDIECAFCSNGGSCPGKAFYGWDFFSQKHACTYACVRAAWCVLECVHACIRACVRACVRRARIHACLGGGGWCYLCVCHFLTNCAHTTTNADAKSVDGMRAIQIVLTREKQRRRNRTSGHHQGPVPFPLSLPRPSPQHLDGPRRIHHLRAPPALRQPPPGRPRRGAPSRPPGARRDAE